MFYLYLKPNITESLKSMAAGLTILAMFFVPFYPIYVFAEETEGEAAVEEITSSTEPEFESEPLTPSEPMVSEVEPTDSEPEPQSETEVETGDALSEAEIENIVNLNEIGTGTTTEEEKTEFATTTSATTTTDEIIEEVTEIIEENASSTTDLDISLENEGVVENEVEVEAETGENEVSNESGEVLIDTGDAYAGANVVSVVNLNLIESNGFLYLLNNFLRSMGHIDLRPLTTTSSTTTPSINPCGTSDCNATTTSLNNIDVKNEAEISNAVIVRSSTGGNTAEGGDSASVTTGDAYAGANVVNVANTNIVDSNYLLFAFNNFGGWDGDLIFPSADFFSSFFSPSLLGSGANLSINNSANIENTVETSAETGGNESEGVNSEIETGNAVAGSNVTNITNTNVVNSPTFYVIFRIFGSWDGSVFNAPEGINWIETPRGIELFSKGNGESENESTDGGANLNLEAENNADITNNVKVVALTGENKATSTGVNASINTGNAYAGTNLLNVANTNIISSNWIIALVNIFGDWSGNISFGQPDLWVATRVEAPTSLDHGTELIFHTTIANRGDAPASNVYFNGYFGPKLIKFNDTEDKDHYSWNVGNLLPGETREFSYKAKVVPGGLPYGDTLIDHKFNVSLLETDGNIEDNSDSVPLLVYRPAPFFPPPGGSETKTTTYPDIEIRKTNSANGGSITASSTLDYTIVVKNNGGSSFESVLFDVLEDEEGNTIAENDWFLGEIFPNEEITVTYTAVFNASTTPGTYTNYAWVEALGGNYLQNPALGSDASSEVTSSSVVVEAVEKTEGEVLGVSCGLYMDKFIRMGMNNDQEQVKKLQEFLNKEIEANLPVTGFYGLLTLQATKAFQEKYAEEILEPWGELSPTGIVYQTTLRWINKISCPSLSISIPRLVTWSQNSEVSGRLAIADTNDRLSPAKLNEPISFQFASDKQEDENIVETYTMNNFSWPLTEKKERNFLRAVMRGIMNIFHDAF